LLIYENSVSGLEFKYEPYFLDGNAVIESKMNGKGSLYEKREMERHGNFYYFGASRSFADKSIMEKDGQWKIRG
jgi:hypothetical protein